MVTDEERAEDLARQRAVVKKANRIPYDVMDRAVAHFRERFPDAKEIQPGMYLKQVYCTVFSEDGRGQVYYYEED